MLAKLINMHQTKFTIERLLQHKVDQLNLK